MNHRPEDLVTLFNTLFRNSLGTMLVKGSGEPEYLPADGEGNCARIIFAHGFFASALHEISHWCIAGAERRQQVDYGYWYCPDGRSVAQQQAFEQVEVKPQALEWLFTIACGRRFHISVDNLDGGGAVDADGFRQRVQQQARRYLDRGLPQRAARFLDALIEFYGSRDAFETRCKAEFGAGHVPEPTQQTEPDQAPVAAEA